MMDSLVSNNTRSFDLMVFNIQGLNYDKVNNIVITGYYSSLKFICLTEIWRSQFEIGNYVFPGFTLASCFGRESLRHGGCAIWCSLDIESECLSLGEFCVEGTFEICGLRWSTSSRGSVCMLNCYRPPKGNYDDFELGLDRVLSDVCSKCNSVLLLGDFNINSMTKKQVTSFTGLLETYSLFPNISVPTRVTDRGGTVLDQVYSDKSCGGEYEVLDTTDSDHRVVLYSTGYNSEHEPKKRYIHKRLFSEKRVERFINHIANVEWDGVYAASDIEGKFDAFHNVIVYYFLLDFPVVKRKLNDNNDHKYWITDDVVNSSQNLKLLFRLYRDHLLSRADYVEARKCHSDLVRDSKKRYYNSVLNNSGNRGRTLWNICHQITGRHKSHKNINISLNGDIIEDPYLVANTLNDFFIDTPLDIVNSIPPPGRVVPGERINDGRSLFVSYVAATEVEFIIRDKIKNSSACGPDGIPSFLLKKIGTHVADPLAHVINFSLASGNFPSKLKLSCVSAVYKKGDNKRVENYRPISLTSAFSKVFEYAILHRLHSFLGRHNVLDDSQHGFRPGLSTMTAVQSFYEQAVSTIDRGECPAGVFCDLSRAFDCISHGKLLERLESYGIRGQLLLWFGSFLAGRRQYVRIPYISDDGRKFYMSEQRDVAVGVPQGSVLGPVLFVLYINSLPGYLKDIHTTLYADDTSLLITGTDGNFQQRVDDTLGHLHDWFSSSSLYLNPEKTRFLLFHTRQRFSLPSLRVCLGNTLLEPAHSVTFLGIIFDDMLTFRPHCLRLVKAVNSGCYLLRSLRRVLDVSDLLACYFAEIHSRLSYGIAVWGCCSDLHEVFLAQKRVIRCIAGVSPRYSCRGLFRRYGILPVPSVYIYELLLYVFRNKNKFLNNTVDHPYSTRNRDLLRLPMRHLAVTFKTPSCLGLKLYNLIPKEISGCYSLLLFKKSIKRLLLSLCCYSVDEYIEALRQ